MGLKATSFSQEAGIFKRPILQAASVTTPQAQYLSAFR